MFRRIFGQFRRIWQNKFYLCLAKYLCNYNNSFNIKNKFQIRQTLSNKNQMILHLRFHIFHWIPVFISTSSFPILLPFRLLFFFSEQKISLWNNCLTIMAKNYHSILLYLSRLNFCNILVFISERALETWHYGEYITFWYA